MAFKSFHPASGQAANVAFLNLISFTRFLYTALAVSVITFPCVPCITCWVNGVNKVNTFLPPPSAESASHPVTASLATTAAPSAASVVIADDKGSDNINSNYININGSNSNSNNNNVNCNSSAGNSKSIPNGFTESYYDRSNNQIRNGHQLRLNYRERPAHFGPTVRHFGPHHGPHLSLDHRAANANGPTGLVRRKRQDPAGAGGGGAGLDDESKGLTNLVCDFGTAGNLDLCSWTVPEESHVHVRWRTGTGSSAYWLGGPLVDKTSGENTGGYVYFETSYKAVNRVFSSAALESGTTNFDGSPLRIQIFDDSSAAASSGTFTVVNTTSLNGPGSLHLTNGTNGTLNSLGSSLLTGTGSNNSPVLFKSALSISNLDPAPVDSSVVPAMAHLISPNITVPGPQGLCFNFYYNLDGLSAEKLRILIRDVESESNSTIWESASETEGKWIRAAVAYSYETPHQLILEGVAKAVDEPERAYRGFVAVDDLNLQPMTEGNTDACFGHCTFEGGMCGWTNLEEGDDFNWILARGSDNFYTGPARDFYSFSKEYPLGGFLYIEAGYPRRPGDRAVLLSPTFEPTGENQAICFKFATHMYGNGVGSLRVWFRPNGEGGTDGGAGAGGGGGGGGANRILWEMTGDSGNNWYIAQLPIASAVSFQIAFEAVVGLNYLGNIAIDSISLEQGSCPISPQTASRKSGDCTFEENMCFWTNPVTEARLDDFDWIRQFSYGNFGPRTDHTKRTSLGYFMSLNGDHLQPKRGGTFAWLISGEFTGSSVATASGGGSNSPAGASASSDLSLASSSLPKCMSFYYYMYQRVIDPGGPSLGGLRIYIRTIDSLTNSVILIPVWRLNNHQSMKWRRARVSLAMASTDPTDGSKVKKAPVNPYQVVIEGIWGDARVGSIAIDDISFVDGECITEPMNAIAVQGECSFDRDLCGWLNLTKTSQIALSNGIRSGVTTLDLKTPSSSSASSSSSSSSSSSGPPGSGTSVLGSTSGSGGSSSSSVLLPKSTQLHPLGHRLNNGESITWRLASPNSRPANLQDHTFRAPIGFVFFDVFNQNQVQTAVLRSRKLPPREGEVTSTCLSFWFSPFGRSEVTQLSVYQTIEGSIGDADIGEPGSSGGGGGAGGGAASSDGTQKVLLWSILTRKFDTRRPTWYYGQVTVNAATRHEVYFEGEAMDGGFALDDITFYPGACQTRPKDAAVVTNKATEE